MKIRCDVCDKKEASVFCTADEAALCDDCDNRVHHANKLASKHSRFSLLQPGFKESPLCDICQTNNNDDFDSNKCYLNSSQDQDDQVGQYDYWVP
uniref:B box-type domain-containing protein n=1 Tax=Cannabis sativa TaxID=3483 RepID=A0A803Q9R0_CANSA